MKPGKTTSQLLQEAKALLQQGWCKERLHRGPRHARQHCIWGALNLVGRRTKARYAAACALHRALPPPHRGLVQFNDHDETTHNEVLALFDRALTEVTK